ncbi:MAG: hypothetical protein KIS88_10010 [Anaerolineales bacterium]|nr:hypothetical protein [Anaerolineales bacterium]
MQKHILLALSLLLSACAAAPANQPDAPANQPSATAAQPAAAATVEAGPTAEPSPTTPPLPYSGPNPRLAVTRWDEDRDAPIIDVFELGSEELLASIPVDDAWRVALSPDGSMLFSFSSDGAGILYDLDSGDSRVVDLSGLVSANGYLYQVAWAPSQQWLSMSVSLGNGNYSLWLYSLQTEQFTYIDETSPPYFEGSQSVNWSTREDVLSYVRAWRASGPAPRFTYDYATGQQTAWPYPNTQTLSALIKHSGLTPETFRCEICVHPDLGMVHDFRSRKESPVQYYYQLYDFEKMELLAHVATFETEREDWREYNVDVLKMFPLWERGDYLLFVHEFVSGPGGDGYEHRFYSAWNPSGEVPFTVVEGEQAYKLPNVIPVALSPDGSSFVGLRLDDDGVWGGAVVSALVVDLATAEVLYEFLLPGYAGYSPPNLEGGHLVWPTE